jgi:peptidoglycan hydrolase-like protein with peptidoglycan-binding domain
MSTTIEGEEQVSPLGEKEVSPLESDLSPVARDEQPAAKRRWWPWLVGAAVIVGVAAVVGVILASNGASEESAEVGVVVNTAEVIRTDLEEITTLDGTLGRTVGDPITASSSGTVTAAPQSGAVVEQGGVLFEIDGEPVVLLYGSVPAYRDLSVSDDPLVVTSRSNGTVTWVADEGAVVEQGDVLFEINGEPVVALYGDVPAFRTIADPRVGDNLTGVDVLQLETALVAMGFDPDGTLTVDEEFTGRTEDRVEDWQESLGVEETGAVTLGSVVFIPGPTEIIDVEVTPGDVVNDGRVVMTLAGDEPMEGVDVLQLETALTALGFDADGTMNVDGVFTSETKAAVIAWQESVGLDGDGIVQLGQVVFLSEAVRISDRTTPPGSPVNPGGAVLAITGNDIVVTAQLSAADQGTLEAGDAVIVELPSGREVGATVESVDTVATRTNEFTYFEVIIVLDDPSVAGALDEAPVDVEYITDSVSNVVAVPVIALLALREGGYAVEIDNGDGTTRLISVEPGFYADGFVEVESEGLTTGMLVIVP